MLKLQEFIKNNPLDWEEKLKNDPYNIAIKHDLGCVIFNYNLTTHQLRQKTITGFS